MLRVSCLALSLISLTAPASARPLNVYWIDVEGGAATLIVTPAGESVLVDTGNPGGRDAGRIHQVATRVAGLGRIDHVVITHLHRDHFGGLAELAEKMPVGTVWSSPVEAAPAKERAQPDVSAYRAAKVGKRVTVQAGDEIPLAQARGAASVRLGFLGARQDLLTPPDYRPNDELCKELVEKPLDFSDNANSLSFVLELGRFRFFDGGDLTWNVEGRLVCPFDRVGPVDVYQSNHHGLESSNNPVLVKALAPTVVVFNNGAKKGCAPAAFAAAKAPVSVKAVYQVHKNLNEGASNTEEVQIANLEEACAGDHVAMSVEPDGERYMVEVPARGHRQAYATRAAR